MTKKTKEHILSASITFIVAFCLSVAATIGDGVPLEQSAMLSALAVALRAGVKELIVFLTGILKPE